MLLIVCHTPAPASVCLQAQCPSASPQLLEGPPCGHVAEGDAEAPNSQRACPRPHGEDPLCLRSHAVFWGGGCWMLRGEHLFHGLGKTRKGSLSIESEGGACMCMHVHACVHVCACVCMCLLICACMCLCVLVWLLLMTWGLRSCCAFEEKQTRTGEHLPPR